MSTCPAPDVRRYETEPVLREIKEFGRLRMGWFRKVGWIRTYKFHRHPVIHEPSITESIKDPFAFTIETIDHPMYQEAYWDWQEVEDWN